MTVGKPSRWMIPLTAALLVAGCHRGGAAGRPGATASAQAAQLPPVPVTTSVVHAQPVSRSLEVDGQVIARNQVQVLPKTSGRIVSLKVGEGDRVHAGQVIAQLDTPEVGWQLQQQKAALSSAQANLENAQDNARRMRELADQGVVSQQQMVQARTQAEVAASQVKSARDAIALYEAQVANGTITSPIDGVVVAKNQDQGAMASPTAPIVTIAQVGDLQVKLPVAERDLGLVRQGGLVEVTSVAFPDRRFRARISDIAPMVDPQTRLITVKADLADPGPLKVGMNVTGAVAGDAHTALVVPLDSVVTAGAEQIVYLVQGAHAHRVPVQTGLRASDSVEVTEGVKPGDVVVAKGSAFLKDGDPITVKGGAS